MTYKFSRGASDQHCGEAGGHVDTCRTDKSNSTPEFASLRDLQSCGLGSTCRKSCGRLLGLLDNLAAKQRVLDGDLSGPAFDDALHAVWLQRRACEAAARICRSTPSAQHMISEGMCVAMEEYSSTVWELDV